MEQARTFCLAPDGPMIAKFDKFKAHIAGTALWVRIGPPAAEPDGLFGFGVPASHRHMKHHVERCCTPSPQTILTRQPMARVRRSSVVWSAFFGHGASYRKVVAR